MSGPGREGGEVEIEGSDRSEPFSPSLKSGDVALPDAFGAVEEVAGADRIQESKKDIVMENWVFLRAHIWRFDRPKVSQFV